MQLYLYRHAKTLNNANNITQDRNDDIDVMPVTLPKHSLPGKTLLVSSITKRAMSTLLQIKNFADDHAYSSDLNEIDFGVYGGKPEHYQYHDLTMADYRCALLAHEFVGYPNGESLVNINQRIGTLMAWLHTETKYDNIILVGHCRFFRHLQVALGMVQHKDMFTKKIPHNELVSAGDMQSLSIISQF